MKITAHKIQEIYLLSIVPFCFVSTEEAIITLPKDISQSQRLSRLLGHDAVFLPGSYILQDHLIADSTDKLN